MAGMPRGIVERANTILQQLEQKSISQNGEGADAIEASLKAMPVEQPVQLSIFETADPTAGKLKAALEDLDLNSMTPIECMLKLNELKGILEE